MEINICSFLMVLLRVPFAVIYSFVLLIKNELNNRQHSATAAVQSGAKGLAVNSKCEGWKTANLFAALCRLSE